MLTIPNLLTILRIFLVPVLVVVLLTRMQNKEFIGLAIFILASVTDFLDGYLARRYNQVTVMGKLLDPIADKLLISAAFISLVELKIAPAWMVVIIIGREFAVSGLRSVVAKMGQAISASPLGKFKMGSQVVCISLLILGDKLGDFMFLGTISLWVVLVAAIGSMVDYFARFWKILTQETTK